MISPKFYSQITICPACFGWGTKESPPTKYTDICRECLGQGISVVQSENIYILDAPTYIDYKSRMRVLILRILAVLLIIAFVLLITLFIRFVLLRSLGI